MDADLIPTTVMKHVLNGLMAGMDLSSYLLVHKEESSELIYAICYYSAANASTHLHFKGLTFEFLEEVLIAVGEKSDAFVAGSIASLEHITKRDVFEAFALSNVIVVWYVDPAGTTKVDRLEQEEVALEHV